MEDHERVAREVFATFLVGAPKKRKRLKPNRCKGCGKVTRYIFCKDTYEECQELWRARQKG